MELCPVCGIKYGRGHQKSRHHILPRRWFKHSELFILCRKDHDDLERLIPFEKRPRAFYYKVLRQFVESHGGEVTFYYEPQEARDYDCKQSKKDCKPIVNQPKKRIVNQWPSYLGSLRR